ncbi:DUF1906 domain-containing protein [Streptomyces sp. NBC_01304]|uniref:DUF1906 domain-containing protein n=1 Tax=Streptomyces sp. NBC_01304 TaxID=2903818 RepID=UPI002E140AF1|nr:DUF1906 domain-containing protein [Streptomyces sp. NBC_01304]
MYSKRPIIGLALTLLALVSFAAPSIAQPADADTRSAGADARPAERPRAAAETFHGWAFDTCLAPPLATMSAWRASKYRAVGVYYAGRGRHCKNQPQLNADWMRSVKQMGWRVLPTYVGSQPPCVTAKHKKTVRIGRNPWWQGTREGRDAVLQAKKLAIQPGSPLYLDMEAYRLTKRSCRMTTLWFVRAWNREVRRHGYIPGFYSSANSGIRHMEMARRAGFGDLPSVIWFARWRTKPNLNTEPMLHRAAWQPERRIHQFMGNVRETHGGRALVIDQNLMHAPVARIR